MTASLALAKEISVDAPVVAAVVSELNGILGPIDFSSIRGSVMRN